MERIIKFEDLRVCKQCGLVFEWPNKRKKKCNNCLKINTDNRRKIWDNENKDRVKRYKDKDNMIRFNRPGFYTSMDKEFVFNLYGYECIYCLLEGKTDSKAENIDHIIPLSNPRSTNYIDNIMPICVKHNREKHTRGIDFLNEKRKESRYPLTKDYCLQLRHLHCRYGKIVNFVIEVTGSRSAKELSLLKGEFKDLIMAARRDLGQEANKFRIMHYLVGEQYV